MWLEPLLKVMVETSEALEGRYLFHCGIELDYHHSPFYGFKNFQSIEMNIFTQIYFTINTFHKVKIKQLYFCLRIYVSSLLKLASVIHVPPRWFCCFSDKLPDPKGLYFT